MQSQANQLTLAQPAGGVQRRRARLFLRPQWRGEEGVRNLLSVAIPLVMAHAVLSVNMFFDRTLLAWFSADAFTAALQAGVVQWMLLTLFHQTVLYASTFVAQYKGARESRMFGPVVWQAIYFALLGGAAVASISWIGYPLFRWIGHAGELPLLEAQYFQVLTWGGVSILLHTALFSFYMGRGRTWLILFVNGATCLLNICLNIWMIFEPIWIFPDGIRGAAWATNLANMIGFFIFVALILAEKNSEARFAILSGWRFNKALFKRLMQFGLPAGVHGMVDALGFTMFLLVVGVFGFQAQHATNMAVNVNLLLFIPPFGLMVAMQVLAGELCGGGRPDGVERLAAGGAVITLTYMSLVIGAYLFLPEVLVGWFRGGMAEAEWREAMKLARTLLMIVAAYSLFDALMLIYSGLLRGAGDTKFVMWASVIFSQTLMVWPCIALALLRDQFANPLTGMYATWGFVTAHIVFLGTVNVVRFWSGHWRHIQMIERRPANPGEAPAGVLEHHLESVEAKG